MPSATVLFTRHLRDSIMRNVAITFEFHRCFLDDRSRAGLERLIHDHIRLPGSLA